MKITAFGPGDEQTWPACTGHPLDPRTEGDMDGDTEHDPRAVVVLPREYRDDADDYS